MITREADTAKVSGRLTMLEAAAALEAGRAQVVAGVSAFDLAGVSEADSAALGVIFGWLREARVKGVTLRFTNTPANLRSLAEVYGVSELLPAA